MTCILHLMLENCNVTVKENMLLESISRLAICFLKIIVIRLLSNGS